MDRRSMLVFIASILISLIGIRRYLFQQDTGRQSDALLKFLLKS